MRGKLRCRERKEITERIERRGGGNQIAVFSFSDSFLVEMDSKEAKNLRFFFLDHVQCFVYIVCLL